MRKNIETWFIFIFLSMFTLMTFYPVLNIIGVSLRTDNAFQSKSLSIYESPEPFIDSNQNGKWDKNESYEDKNKNGKRDNGSNLNSYVKLFETDFLKWTFNSIIISLVVTLAGVVLASTSAYALSRYQFKGRQFGMIALLTTQMFPATMLLLPFFIILSKLSLINSYLGLIIIYASTALPFCIWQMKGFYDTIPPSLEESACMDGCNQFQAFYKIIFYPYHPQHWL